MESDIYGNTALPLAPDLQSLQTSQTWKVIVQVDGRNLIRVVQRWGGGVLWDFETQMYTFCRWNYLSLPTTGQDLTQGLFCSGDLGVCPARSETYVLLDNTGHRISGCNAKLCKPLPNLLACMPDDLAGLAVFGITLYFLVTHNESSLFAALNIWFAFGCSKTHGV